MGLVLVSVCVRIWCPPMVWFMAYRIPTWLLLLTTSRTEYQLTTIIHTTHLEGKILQFAAYIPAGFQIGYSSSRFWALRLRVPFWNFSNAQNASRTLSHKYPLWQQRHGCRRRWYAKIPDSAPQCFQIRVLNQCLAGIYWYAIGYCKSYLISILCKCLVSFGVPYSWHWDGETTETISHHGGRPTGLQHPVTRAYTQATVNGTQAVEINWHLLHLTWSITLAYFSTSSNHCENALYWSIKTAVYSTTL